MNRITINGTPKECTIRVNGEHVGYSEEWRVYINGRYVGECDGHNSLMVLIRKELQSCK